MPGVKTAVSLPRAVFEEVEAEARELKVPRSRLFVIALEEYFQRRRKERLLEQINATCGDQPDEEEKAFLEMSRRRILETTEPW